MCGRPALYFGARHCLQLWLFEPQPSFILLWAQQGQQLRWQVRACLRQPISRIEPNELTPDGPESVEPGRE